MTEIVLNIAPSHAIETEVDAFREYIYARQALYERYRKALNLKIINPEDERCQIEQSLFDISQG